MNQQEAQNLINQLLVSDRMYQNAQIVEDFELWRKSRDYAELELLQALTKIT